MRPILVLIILVSNRTVRLLAGLQKKVTKVTIEPPLIRRGATPSPRVRGEGNIRVHK